jgi:hypothetical protein
MPAAGQFFGFMEIFMGGERYFRTLPKSFLDLKRIPYQHLRHPPALVNWLQPSMCPEIWSPKP